MIANATRDRTGNWYALNEYEMVRAVRYAGKVYQNEMARAVQELGYAIRQVRGNTRFWPVSKAGNTPATRAYRLSIRMATRWDSAIPAPDPPPPCRCELFAFTKHAG